MLRKRKNNNNTVFCMFHIKKEGKLFMITYQIENKKYNRQKKD